MSAEVHSPRLVAYSGGTWFEAPRTHPTHWTCHAKPAATGKTCGHVNAAGIHHNGHLSVGDAVEAAGDGFRTARIFAIAPDGTETPLPSYEEALAEIAAAHEALDPVVARRDAVTAPPLSLAVRCTTAVQIALERFCADPLAALEAAERRLLEGGGWREIGPANGSETASMPGFPCRTGRRR